MSFHENIDNWNKLAVPENCPVCNQAPMPEGMIDLAELQYSWVNTEPIECMKWACHITSKFHGIVLFDLEQDELHHFMDDVAVCAKALQVVTNAVKINYEIHGNTLPHLHVHLYPRFVDDPFPGKPIDYNQKRPIIYQPGEFETFVFEMKQKLKELLNDGVKT